jgi:nickel/cobalt transporter (NicO) family protein
MQLMARLLLFLVVALFGLAPFASAQESAQQPEKKTIIIDKRKLLVQPRNADGTIQEAPFMEDPVLWMRTKQQSFYGKMSNTIRQMKSQSATSAAWTLLTISFLYGVFHAAGPGHGKAVVTGWVLATENQLRRGILIAFLSALIQALTAIIVVSALLLFVRGASAMARDVAGFLESASYLMIAGMGAYLVWNGWNSFRPKPASLSAAAVTVPGPFELVSRPESGHDHVHDENCGCGHAHMPAASAVNQDMTWRSTFAMAFAVGIRPCSGAILVLVASYTLGLYWAGVLSTLAMGVGVFLTISVIATLAVYAKTLALRLTGADNPWTNLAVKWGKVMMGIFIAGFGLLLFTGSLGSSSLVM